MRVGLFTPRLGFLGGLERHAWDLARALGERGHRLVLVHGTETGRDPALYASAFAEVRSSASPRCGDALDVVWVQKAADVRELASFEGLPLVVAAHDHELSCVRTHRYLPVGHAPCHRATGLTCVAHGCALVRERRPTARLRVGIRNPFALRRRVQELSRRAPLVANSHYVAATLEGAGAPASRIRVIHPVPPDASRPPVAPPAAPRLLVVGQLVRGKGVDLAIRALARLAAPVELTVAGDGPSRARLESLAQRCAPGRVRFLGYRPPDEVERLYDECRVAVLPSRWPEPFGMVGIEAMRRARPVVGAAHGGIVEWLLDGIGGRLFAPGSVESLAEALQRALAEPELGARACELARTRFAHSRMIDQVEALLRELADGTQRA